MKQNQNPTPNPATPYSQVRLVLDSRVPPPLAPESFVLRSRVLESGPVLESCLYPSMILPARYNLSSGVPRLPSLAVCLMKTVNKHLIPSISPSVLKHMLSMGNTLPCRMEITSRPQLKSCTEARGNYLSVCSLILPEVVLVIS